MKKIWFVLESQEVPFFHERNKYFRPCSISIRSEDRFREGEGNQKKKIYLRNKKEV
jgi:hypothetical protein